MDGCTCVWVYRDVQLQLQVYKCLGVHKYRCTSVYASTGVQVFGYTGMYNCIGENCYFTLKCKNKDMISKHLIPI